MIWMLLLPAIQWHNMWDSHSLSRVGGIVNGMWCFTGVAVLTNDRLEYHGMFQQCRCFIVQWFESGKNQQNKAVISKQTKQENLFTFRQSNMTMESHHFLDELSIETFIHVGCSFAMFDYCKVISWLVVSTPLKHISQLGWFFPI